MAGKKIYVYAHWAGMHEAALVGILTALVIRGKEIFSFEYSGSWLSNGQPQNLDPDLRFYAGAQYATREKPGFGLFLDSSPDRWGKVLMKRREAIIARKEDRKPNVLHASDFMLGVYDENRMGALRFKTDPDNGFVSADKELAAPPWTSLRDLEYASLQLENDKLKDKDAVKWLNMLFAPGSSLGGARPKASVKDPAGHLWIAKFPGAGDEHDAGGWEYVAMQLAKDAGLNVSTFAAKRFSNKHHTFLGRRFDRTPDGARIHFASAMTLLGYSDGADYHDGASYLELAQYIMQHGSNVDHDLEELWKRIVLNICIRNTDDHLRNHGFLLGNQGWTLSPLYDINPNPDGTGLTLNISENDNSLNLDLAFSVIRYFRVKEKRAIQIVNKIKASTRNWRRVANEMKLLKREQTKMEMAFENGKA